MKTANELAQEYFAKTPMERLHTTLQDYVYDYQKTKIDAVIALIETTQSNEKTAFSDNNFLKLKIKEILK